MSDAGHTDAKLRRVASAMRETFFEEFGSLDDMSEGQMQECIKSLIAIHAGELIEVAARFGSRPVRDTCIDFIDAMIRSNGQEIARLMKQSDPLDYLVGNR